MSPAQEADGENADMSPAQEADGQKPGMPPAQGHDGQNRALVEIEADNPQLIIDALKPDLSPSRKFNASLNPSGRKLVLTVESAEIGGLTAGLSSYLRLIRAASEASKIG